jgi:xylulose-5-phosphate/fructose-6-phosphate phosphoketolase
VSVPTPGSIHEGGELGYVLAHAFGAAFDNPDLIVATVVGDGEAETGPLADSWKGASFLNPVRDGAVLPILHLNGYKIASPTVFGRMSDDDVRAQIESHGYEVHFVEGDDPAQVHQAFAAVLDACYEKIVAIQQEARTHGFWRRPHWPAIVLRTPKGWTGPREVDGFPVEGTFRAHQIPVAEPTANPDHLAILEQWLRSYRPEDVFDSEGRLSPDLASLAPHGERRMGANPHANGGKLLVNLDVPDYHSYAIEVPRPATVRHESTRQLGMLLRDVFIRNDREANFRLLCPDELRPNRLESALEATNRLFLGRVLQIDDRLSSDGAEF